MKACNLVLGMVLAANVLTAQGDVFTTTATTAAITTANTVMLTSDKSLVLKYSYRNEILIAD